jgi:branched-chain amino acid transport system substrate-binding protein
MVGAGLAAAIVVSACSSSGTSSGKVSASLPSSIQIPSLMELSGPIAPYGQMVVNGEELAVSQVNDAHFLGNTKLSLNVENTDGDPATGASLTTHATANKAPVILGSLSVPAAAEAPVAERAGVPLLQFSGTTTISSIGKYIYSAGAPQSGYTWWDFKYLKDHNISSVGIIYASDNPTCAGVATVTVPALSRQYGVPVVTTQAILSTATATSSVVDKVIAKKPGAIMVVVPGGLNATLVSQIKSSGFNGLIVGSIAMSGVLTSLKSEANGVIWPTAFTVKSTAKAAMAFTTAYQQKFHSLPNLFAAQGFDATWLIAKAIKDAGSDAPAAINTWINKLTSAGVQGSAEGTIKYAGRIASVPGLLIEYENGDEVPVPNYGS